MERKKYLKGLFIVTLIMQSYHLLSAQQYSTRIYNAYLASDLQEWINVMDEMEQSGNTNTDYLLELLGYYYGYTGYLLETGNTKQAKNYIKKGEDKIDRILKTEPENARALSYKGTFIAFKMSMAPLKAMVLGPQTMKYINKAYSLEPAHFQIIADKANMLYYAPVLFGGNKKEALSLYKEAIRIMAAREDRSSNWFYLNLQNALADMYTQQGEIEEARRIYLQLLNEEPRYTIIEEKLSTLPITNF